MSYKQAMKWHKKHPKGIPNLYMGFDASTAPAKKTRRETIEFYYQKYLPYHIQNRSAEKGIMVYTLRDYIKQMRKIGRCI